MVQIYEWKELERECNSIYQNCMAGLKIGPRSFVKYANHVRFNLVLHDRNRMGVYSFTNMDFAERKPKYLPHESFFPEDGFRSLPSDWNPDCAPYDGAEPSCYVMELTGDNRGLKGGKTASVILSKSVIELCLRYREMKRTNLLSLHTIEMRKVYYYERNSLVTKRYQITL